MIRLITVLCDTTELNGEVLHLLLLLLVLLALLQPLQLLRLLVRPQVLAQQQLVHQLLLLELRVQVPLQHRQVRLLRLLVRPQLVLPHQHQQARAQVLAHRLVLQQQYNYG